MHQGACDIFSVESRGEAFAFDTAVMGQGTRRANGNDQVLISECLIFSVEKERRLLRRWRGDLENKNGDLGTLLGLGCAQSNPILENKI